MSKNVFLLLSIISLFSACAPPLPDKLIIDSKISNPLDISEDTISTEPTIFVRATSHDASGAEDLDQLIEKKLTSYGHRLNNRSDTAKIKLLANLKYIGEAKNLDPKSMISSGYDSKIPVTITQNHKYDYIAIIDLKVTIFIEGLEKKQVCRVFIGTRSPTPIIAQQKLRNQMMAKAADQISVFFAY